MDAANLKKEIKKTKKKEFLIKVQNVLLEAELFKHSKNSKFLGFLFLNFNVDLFTLNLYS